MEGYVISGIKVVNIFEENAASIEKMTNQMITDLHTKKNTRSSSNRRQSHPMDQVKKNNRVVLNFILKRERFAQLLSLEIFLHLHSVAFRSLLNAFDRILTQN